METTYSATTAVTCSYCDFGSKLKLKLHSTVPTSWFRTVLKVSQQTLEGTR
jgi:hypothetical protein